jgi:hypothetical protein
MRMPVLLQLSAGYRRPRRHWLPRQRCAVGSLMIVVSGILTVVALSACAVARPDVSAPGAVRRVVALGPDSNWVQPLHDAHRMSIFAARHAVGFAVPMPDVSSPILVASEPASQITLRLSQAWVGPGRELALIFDLNKVTILVGRAQYKNPAQEFRRELAAIHVGRAAIGRVRGGSALVIQPRTDYIRANPALVEFYLRGLDVEVLSTRLDTTTLLAIADSIHPRGL